MSFDGQASSCCCMAEFEGGHGALTGGGQICSWFSCLRFSRTIYLTHSILLPVYEAKGCEWCLLGARCKPGQVKHKTNKLHSWGLLLLLKDTTTDNSLFG